MVKKPSNRPLSSGLTNRRKRIEGHRLPNTVRAGRADVVGSRPKVTGGYNPRQTTPLRGPTVRHKKKKREGSSVKGKRLVKKVVGNRVSKK